MSLSDEGPRTVGTRREQPGSCGRPNAPWNPGRTGRSTLSDRYPQAVFVNGYVAANLGGGRFADVAANRRAGVAIEAQHRAAFAGTGAGGHPWLRVHKRGLHSQRLVLRLVAQRRGGSGSDSDQG
jgi:hypothetical protein